jgi:hypothetical protein
VQIKAPNRTKALTPPSVNFLTEPQSQSIPQAPPANQQITTGKLNAANHGPSSKLQAVAHTKEHPDPASTATNNPAMGSLLCTTGFNPRAANWQAKA